MKKKFYSVHVFFSRKDGYSVPVVIESEEEFLTDDQIIDHVVKNDLLNATSDANHIDTIDEIDENEYNLMKD